MRHAVSKVGNVGRNLGLVALSFLAPAVAFAQGGGAAVEFDTAPVLEIVSDAQAFIVTIGLAVLTLLMVAKGIKWARKAG